MNAIVTGTRGKINVNVEMSQKVEVDKFWGCFRCLIFGTTGWPP